jgi:hypothetical protein
MHDDDQHNRGEPNDQLLSSVIEAFLEPIAKIHVVEQPLKHNTSRERTQALILEAKLRNTLDIRMNL